MVKSILRSLALLIFSLSARSQDYPVQPVPFTQVHLTDNFLMAAGKKKTTKLTEFPFDDTDLYKVIEGASYSLQVRPDARLSAQLDTLIAVIGAAQEPDGNLYTFRTAHPGHPHEWIWLFSGRGPLS